MPRRNPGRQPGEGVPSQPDRRRALGGELANQGIDLLHRADRRAQRYGPECLRLGSVYQAAGQHQLQYGATRHATNKYGPDHHRPQPHVDLGVPKRACSAATTMSHAAASPNPPASAARLPGRSSAFPIAAWSATSRQTPCFHGAVRWACRRTPRRSPPAENARSPAPVTTTTRTCRLRRRSRGPREHLDHRQRQRVAPVGIVDDQPGGRSTHLIAKH